MSTFMMAAAQRRIEQAEMPTRVPMQGRWIRESTIYRYNDARRPGSLSPCYDFNGRTYVISATKGRRTDGGPAGRQLFSMPHRGWLWRFEQGYHNEQDPENGIFSATAGGLRCGVYGSGGSVNASVVDRHGHDVIKWNADRLGTEKIPIIGDADDCYVIVKDRVFVQDTLLPDWSLVHYRHGKGQPIIIGGGDIVSGGSALGNLAILQRGWRPGDPERIEWFELDKGISYGPIRVDHGLDIAHACLRWTPERGLQLIGQSRDDLSISVWSLVDFPEPKDEIDPSEVTWLHTNISDWRKTSVMARVDVRPDRVCLLHTMAGRWLVRNGAEGNPWVFVRIHGRWYGATYEWLRPGQVCKGVTAMGDASIGSHTKKHPISAWEPRPGEQVGFCVSTLARDHERTSNERSNIVLARYM